MSTSFSTESVVASRTFRSPLFAHIDVGMPPSFSATTTLQYFLSFGSLYPSTLQTPFPASVDIFVVFPPSVWSTIQCTSCDLYKSMRFCTIYLCISTSSCLRCSIFRICSFWYFSRFPHVLRFHSSADCSSSRYTNFSPRCLVESRDIFLFAAISGTSCRE